MKHQASIPEIKTSSVDKITKNDKFHTMCSLVSDEQARQISTS